MNRVAYKIYALVFSAVCCVSFIKCDNFELNVHANNSFAMKTPDISNQTLPALLSDLLPKFPSSPAVAPMYVLSQW